MDTLSVNRNLDWSLAWNWTHIPDSAIMVLISLAMYWMGVPVGGIGRNWMRDLTTSGDQRDQLLHVSTSDG